MRCNPAFIFLLLLLLPVINRADMAPPPGSKSIPVDLLLEAKDDLSDYRFFLRSKLGVEEIAIAKGAEVEIAGEPRREQYQVGFLWAIPRQNLDKYNDGNFNRLSDDISSNKVPGVINVLTLQFYDNVPGSSAEDRRVTKYMLSRDADNQIDARLIASDLPTPRKKYSVLDDSPWRFGSGTVIAFAIIGLSLAALFVWIILKVKVNTSA